jgi:excisionase family DNA binding protein
MADDMRPTSAIDRTRGDDSSAKECVSGLPQRPKLLFTPEEAAAVLSVGRTRVYELIARGQLFSVRIGASRRIPLLALERFVNELARDG